MNNRIYQPTNMIIRFIRTSSLLFKNPYFNSSIRLLSNTNNTNNNMKESTLILANGLLNGRRDCLAKSITLIGIYLCIYLSILIINIISNIITNESYISNLSNLSNSLSNQSQLTCKESTRIDHRYEGEKLLDYIAQTRSNNIITNKSINSKLNTSKYTLRLGIAGPPGAGKSTFIENLGMRLIEKNHRVAVIPVDPSSHISGGSILGDKTRMELLSRSMNAYVRASPTSGVLGGIAEHTSDVISLCEGANFDVIIVESVGLGQSEVEIDNAVDMLLVIVPPGGGDSLQASKKGIMEAADLVIVNKADGMLLQQAKHTKADYSGAMQFIRQKNESWKAKVLMMSAKTSEGVDEIDSMISSYHTLMSNNGELIEKRRRQNCHWMWLQMKHQIIARIENNSLVQHEANKMTIDLGKGMVTPRFAANKLIEVFDKLNKIK